jgi:hypothetical protein
LIDVVLATVGYIVASLVLPVLSFKKIYVPLQGSSDPELKPFGCRYDDSGRLAIGDELAAYIGIVILIIAFLAAGC